MTTETKELMEQVIVEQLMAVGTDEEGVKSQDSERIKRATILIEKLTAQEQMEHEYEIKRDKAKLEKDQLAEQQFEADTKQKSEKWRLVVEIGKVVVPAVLTVAQLAVFCDKYKELLHFEETGRLTSSASRELHLPPIFKRF